MAFPAKNNNLYFSEEPRRFSLQKKPGDRTYAFIVREVRRPIIKKPFLLFSYYEVTSSRNCKWIYFLSLIWKLCSRNSKNINSEYFSASHGPLGTWNNAFSHRKLRMPQKLLRNRMMRTNPTWHCALGYVFLPKTWLINIQTDSFKTWVSRHAFTLYKRSTFQYFWQTSKQNTNKRDTA